MHAALEALCTVSEVENKKLVRELAVQEWRGVTLVTKTGALEERVRAQDILTKRLAEDRDKAQEEYNELLSELQQVRSQLATKGVERDNLNERFTKWKAFDVEQRRKTKATIEALRKERDVFSKVKTH
jgi:hypothetical protein